MATDVPVQLDGVSPSRRADEENSTGSGREGNHARAAKVENDGNDRRNGDRKHAKRSRESRDKDRHKQSKSRKRSKSEHRPERHEREQTRVKSPAVESGEIEAPDGGNVHTSRAVFETDVPRSASNVREDARSRPSREQDRSTRRGGERQQETSHASGGGSRSRPKDLTNARRGSDAPSRRGEDRAEQRYTAPRHEYDRRRGSDRLEHVDTDVDRRSRFERGRHDLSDCRDRRRGGHPAAREQPERRGAPRDRYQRQTHGESERDSWRQYERKGSAVNEGGVRGGEAAPRGEELLAKYEAMVTAEEREAQEVEERRKRRAALAAKIAAQSPAPSKASATPERPRSRSPLSSAGASPRGTTAERSSVARSEPCSEDGLPKVVDAVVVAGDSNRVDALFRPPATQSGLPGSSGNNIADATRASNDSEDDGIFAVDDDDDAPAGGAQADIVAEHEERDDRLRVKQAAQASKTSAGLTDMYDDSQGYYNFRVGEVMSGRYEVVKASGKGVFSSVVTAQDKLRQDTDGGNPLVAIKLIRANETMYKAGQQELAILRKLADADPDNRKHVIRLLRSFEYRNHLCMVFEHMEMNLRELTRKVGVGRGIKIDAVAQLTLQMLIALRHLQSTHVLHADIKPDNVLINARMNKIKLCDMGSALFSGGSNELTPYLVSRFYRAPEVILGLPYGATDFICHYPMDMWSVACTVYEMFTAEILFKGRDNNDMLRQIMAFKGAFPKRMIKKGLFANLHFADDSNLSFISKEKDVVSGEPVRRLVAAPAKRRSLLQLLTRVAAKEHPAGIPRDELRKVESLGAFLERATALDPASRLTVAEAMQSKFIVMAKQQIAAQQAAHRKVNKT